MEDDGGEVQEGVPTENYVRAQHQAMSAYAIRDDNAAANYLALIKLASIRLWLRTYDSTP